MTDKDYDLDQLIERLESDMAVFLLNYPSPL